MIKYPNPENNATLENYMNRRQLTKEQAKEELVKFGLRHIDVPMTMFNPYKVGDIVQISRMESPYFMGHPLPSKYKDRRGVVVNFDFRLCKIRWAPKDFSWIHYENVKKVHER